MSKRGCVEHSLPARLVDVKMKVGGGAYLKRMSDDARAMIVSLLMPQEKWLVVMLSKKALRDGLSDPGTKKDYMLVEIEDDSEWLAITAGDAEDDFLIDQ